MAGGNFKPAPRPKNALDEYKLRLSAPPAQGATKPASMAFSVVSNNPRIDVYTNVPNDKNNGNIRAAMDSPTFYSLLELLEKAINGPADNRYSIKNMNHTFFEGKRSEHPKLISTTTVGKDKEGRVFISLIAKDRPLIKFVFLPSMYHSLVKMDGSDFSEAEMSEVYARAYLNLLRNLVADVLTETYTEPKPRDENGGGNRGGPGGVAKGVRVQQVRHEVARDCAVGGKEGVGQVEKEHLPFVVQAGDGAIDR